MRTSVVSALLCIGMLVVLQLGGTQTRATTSTPLVTPNLVDLGVLWAGKSGTARVHLIGPTDSPWRLARVVKQCSCVTVDRESADVGAGSRVPIELWLMPNEAGESSVEVEFVADSGVRSPVVLRYFGVPPMFVEPPGLTILLEESEISRRVPCRAVQYLPPDTERDPLTATCAETAVEVGEVLSKEPAAWKLPTGKPAGNYVESNFTAECVLPSGKAEVSAVIMLDGGRSGATSLPVIIRRRTHLEAVPDRVVTHPGNLPVVVSVRCIHVSVVGVGALVHEVTPAELLRARKALREGALEVTVELTDGGRRALEVGPVRGTLSLACSLNPGDPLLVPITVIP